MRPLWAVLLILIFLVPASYATSVELYPDVVASGTNREFNLTLNNYNDIDAITNITIETNNFSITQAFGGNQWAVTNTYKKASWYNNTVGTNVVFALFPFRATAPVVSSDSYFNLTITLYSASRIQRLRREVKVVTQLPSETTRTVFSLNQTILRRGEASTIKINANATVVNATSSVFGNTYSLAQATSQDLSLNVPSSTATGDHTMAISGVLDGNSFKQNLSLTVGGSLQIGLESPESVNSSAGFLIKGKITTDDNSSLSGKSVSILWHDGEHKANLDSDNEFVLGLVAPAEKGEVSLIAQFEHTGLIYTSKKMLTISEISQSSTTTVPATPPTPAPAPKPAPKVTPKTTVSASDTPRSNVFDVDPSAAKRKPSRRPYIIGFLVTLLIVLIILAARNVNMGMFMRSTKKEGGEESGDGKNHHAHDKKHAPPLKQPETISWDEYFARRKRREHEKAEGKHQLPLKHQKK